MTVEEKDIKRFCLPFQNTRRKTNMLYSCLFSPIPLPVNRPNAGTYCSKMTRDEDESRSSLKDVFFHCVSLSFFLSFQYLSFSFLFATYDDAIRLLSRYMHPSFTHQAVCNRTIPQFIFHIIVFPFLVCHRGLVLWVLWRWGWDRRADRRKVEGCWASLRGCLAL